MQLCPHCHTGKLTMKKVVFVQWDAETRNTIVDRIPALVCDNCSEKAYAPQALDNLQQLLWTLPQHNKSASRSSRAGNR